MKLPERGKRSCDLLDSPAGELPFIPPPPEEEFLPPRDRPAWTREAIGRFLVSGSPRTKLWALDWVAEHPELGEGPEIVGAVASLLDNPDPFILASTFPVLRSLKFLSSAGGIAELLRERLPRFRPTEFYEQLIWSLAVLEPLGSFEVFREGLESKNRRIQTDAIRGILEGRHENAARTLLEYLQTTADEGLAMVALSAICGLRDAEAAAAGTALLIKLMEACSYPDLTNLGAGLTNDGGLSFDLYFSVQDALYPDEDRKAAPGRFRVFFPKEDPAAARRGRDIVTLARQEEIVRLADGFDSSGLLSLLGALARQAIGRASRENPQFAPLGATLLAMTRVFLKHKRLLREDDQDIVSTIVGTFLATAIRGRDVNSEPEEAARDPEKLLNLCRLDDFWLDSNSLVRVSRLVSEENLVPLLESADVFVRETASVVLCAMRPERYLAGAECLLKPPFQLLLAIAKVAGDALLRPLALLASKGSPREFSSFLGSVITKLGTERARFFLDFYFDVMNEANFPPVRLVAMAQSSGSRSLSAKVVQCLREGKADFNSSINRKFPRQELLDELSLLLELYGISGAADEILLDGEREFMKSGKYRRHEKSPRCDW